MALNFFDLGLCLTSDMACIDFRYGFRRGGTPKHRRVTPCACLCRDMSGTAAPARTVIAYRERKGPGAGSNTAGQRVDQRAKRVKERRLRDGHMTDLLFQTLDAVSRFRVGQREAIEGALEAGAKC